MNDIAKRLKASVKYDAINGDEAERHICSRQMIEAANEIDTLNLRIKQLEEEIRYALNIKNRQHGDDYAYDDCWQRLSEILKGEKMTTKEIQQLKAELKLKNLLVNGMLEIRDLLVDELAAAREREENLLDGLYWFAWLLAHKHQNEICERGCAGTIEFWLRSMVLESGDIGSKENE